MKTFYQFNQKIGCNITEIPQLIATCLLGCILLSFLHCADNPFLSDKSSNAHVITKATSQEDKTLLGNAVLRVSYEVETTSWGEVINQDHARPGSEQIIKNIGLTMVDRTSNVFKLFEDGSYEMTIVKQKPHSDIPNVIYSTPKDPQYENAYKTVITESHITCFDRTGKALFSMPYKGTKMLALVKAISKDCNESKVFVNNLPLLTLNGDATSILSACAKSAVLREGGDITSTKDGLIIVKRKIANMNLEARTLSMMWGGTPPPTSNQTPPAQLPIPPLPDLKGDVPDEEERDQIRQHDMTIMGNMQSQYDASTMESMTIVDSTTNKVLGVAIINHADGNNMSVMSSSRYKYNDDDDKQIRIAHHELYQTDLASGVEVQRNMQQEYENVKVLTKE